MKQITIPKEVKQEAQYLIDRYGDHLTVQVTTAGMELRREALTAALHSLVRPGSILWANDLAARGLENLSREQQSEGQLPENDFCVVLATNRIAFACSR